MPTPRKADNRKTTQRGFPYREIKDSHGCIVRIQESSSACQRCVWIFTDDPAQIYKGDPASPHLTAAQARRVAAALIRFADGGRP